ncbi:hypothetical protein FXO37_21320 [Capsicum annuum]|nr:hypothetical protein FXO37_21320 [Capsicum annuum]
MQTSTIHEKIEPGEVKMLSVAKMVVSEMLKYEYQPKTRLGPKTDGTIEPIQLKHQRGNTVLGYKPTFRGIRSEGLRVIVFVPTQVPVSEQAVDEDIIDGIGNLFLSGIEGEPKIDSRSLPFIMLSLEKS